MALNRRFWEKKAEKNFAEWDKHDDVYGLPLKEFQKAANKVAEGSLIMMMLETMDKEIEKAVDKASAGAKTAFASAVKEAQHA
jgi:hypothetical protein